MSIHSIFHDWTLYPTVRCNIIIIPQGLIHEKKNFTTKVIGSLVWPLITSLIVLELRYTKQLYWAHWWVGGEGRGHVLQRQSMNVYSLFVVSSRAWLKSRDTFSLTRSFHFTTNFKNGMILFDKILKRNVRTHKWHYLYFNIKMYWS